jgi:hypothetical protein
MLVVERGTKQRPPTDLRRTAWEDLIDKTFQKRRPRLVLEVWHTNAQLWSKGPMCKGRTTVWEEFGYVTRCRTIQATDIGGAIHQKKLIVARVQKEWSHAWKWAPEEAQPDLIRPMSNLLTPPGLVPYKAYDRKSTRDPPDARTEPMPGTLGAWIKTEKGIRRVTLEETSRGLGLQKGLATSPTVSLVENTTSIFHWEYLSASLVTNKRRATNKPGPDPRTTIDPSQEEKSEEEQEAFTWVPPDLSVGGAWYCERVASLKKAAAALPNPAKVLSEGLKILTIHRGNYSATGPAAKQLQLVWWEFPSEHWTALREGSRMNFLVTPETRKNPNTPMDQAQLDIAAAFVDELLELGVLLDAEEGMEILLNAPLFVVPKEGQEGEWRVIADML